MASVSFAYKRVHQRETAGCCQPISTSAAEKIESIRQYLARADTEMLVVWEMRGRERGGGGGGGVSEMLRLLLRNLPLFNPRSFIDAAWVMPSTFCKCDVNFRVPSSDQGGGSERVFACCRLLSPPTQSSVAISLSASSHEYFRLASVLDFRPRFTFTCFLSSHSDQQITLKFLDDSLSYCSFQVCKACRVPSSLRVLFWWTGQACLI